MPVLFLLISVSSINLNMLNNFTLLKLIFINNTLKINRKISTRYHFYCGLLLFIHSYILNQYHCAGKFTFATT